MEAAEEKNGGGMNAGWRVTLAGLGINLALGVLYSWSVISGAIADAKWGWSAEERALPYSVACLVFCLVMVPAGRMQDRLGPRLVATLGGILVGIGMITASLGQSVAIYTIGFGVLAGAGIGFGYASATPPAVKWFPAAKTGMIAGIVVSGFGLASVYAAPAARWLAGNYGLQKMMMILGGVFLVVVVALAQFLRAPHRTEQLARGLGLAGALIKRYEEEDAGAPKHPELGPIDMLKTAQFYLLWFMYACGAGAGLMVISICQKINSSAGVGVAAVVALAIGNGGGRVLAGAVSDKLGRKLTLFIFFVLQALAIVALSVASGAETPSGILLIILSALVGANYGSNLALFPSVTKDYYGLRNFGTNYGLVFTAWGIGGFLLAQFAAKVFDGKIVAAWGGDYKFAFYTSAVLLVVAAALTFVLKAPHHAEAALPEGELEPAGDCG